MRRSLVLVVIASGCGGERASSVAKDWTAVEMKPGWGSFVDPDGDCTQTWKEGTLTIAVPGKSHELQGDGKRNAPRLLVDRSGDFAVSLRAAGKLAPKSSAGGKFAPYHGAGIVVWERDAAFVRLERAKLAMPNGGAVTYINFESQGAAGPQPVKQVKLGDDETVFLRVERRGTKLAGLMSRDGAKWESLGETQLASNGPIKVGVAAVNNTAEPFTPEFSDFHFSEATKPAGG